jgi:hypothetical protein
MPRARVTNGTAYTMAASVPTPFPLNYFSLSDYRSTRRWPSTGRPSPHRLPYAPLKRLGPSQRFTGAITCHKPLSVWCHFMSGRTLPCVDKNCPGCAANRRQIRECYVSLYLTNERQHIITVLTPGAELALTDLAPNMSATRGLIITIQRDGKRANGRLRVVVTGDTVNGTQLPPAPDLKAHMYVIWGLTQELMGTEHPLFEVREQFVIPMEQTDGRQQKQG